MYVWWLMLIHVRALWHEPFPNSLVLSPLPALAQLVPQQVQ